MDIISGAGVEYPVPITKFLDNQFRCSKTRITGLRASAVNTHKQSRVWPVVEWREGQDAEVLAVFRIDSQDSPCSYIIHTGVGIGWEGEGRRWRRSSLMWAVYEASQLKELFLAAQNLLGIPQWCDTDPRNDYCNSNNATHAHDEYVHINMLNTGWASSESYLSPDC
jgi:hypothetical protein